MSGKWVPHILPLSSGDSCSESISNEYICFVEPKSLAAISYFSLIIKANVLVKGVCRKAWGEGGEIWNSHVKPQPLETFNVSRSEQQTGPRQSKCKFLLEKSPVSALSLFTISHTRCRLPMFFKSPIHKK